ncbi:MAG: hypothetical protein RIQ79_2651, partial [Verrucomicrobiota bacterium]
MLRPLLRRLPLLAVIWACPSFAQSTPASIPLPFRNPDLPVEQRVSDLLS